MKSDAFLMLNISSWSRDRWNILERIHPLQVVSYEAPGRPSVCCRHNRHFFLSLSNKVLMEASGSSRVGLRMYGSPNATDDFEFSSRTLIDE